MADNTDIIDVQHKKYLDRRYDLFSKFDEGIQIDPGALFSTGPESISKKIARKTGARTVVDGFACVGGSAIGFASFADHVYAIEIDHKRIEMAKNNLEVYGLKDKVEFIEGDFINECLKIKAEAVFLDPPWGGPEYSKIEKFTLDHFSPSGKTLLDLGFKYFPKVVLRVPRNFDMNELEQFQKPYFVDEEIYWGKVIFKTVYFFKPNEE